MRRLYKNLALLLMPHSAPIDDATKNRIATKFATFTLRQFEIQPVYLGFPLKLLGLLVSFSVCAFGARAMGFWKKLPFGNLIDRLFHSFLLLIYFEDDSVLRSLGEQTGKEKLIAYREIWDESKN